MKTGSYCAVPLLIELSPPGLTFKLPVLPTPPVAANNVWNGSNSSTVCVSNSDNLMLVPSTLTLNADSSAGSKVVAMIKYLPPSNEHLWLIWRLFVYWEFSKDLCFLKNALGRHSVSLVGWAPCRLYKVKPITLGSMTLCWFSDIITSSRSDSESCSCGLMWNVSGLFLHPPAVTPRFQAPWYNRINQRLCLSAKDGSSLDVSESKCTHSRCVKTPIKSTKLIQNSPKSNWPSRRSLSVAETLSSCAEWVDQSPV